MVSIHVVDSSGLNEGGVWYCSVVSCNKLGLCLGWK